MYRILYVARHSRFLCFFVLFVFLLCLVHPILSVSLCCPCLWVVHSSLSCSPNVVRVSGLSILRCLIHPMLSVSLGCPFFAVLFIQCCPCLWVVHSSLSCSLNVVRVSGLSILRCLVHPMLSASLGCPFFVVPLVYFNVYVVFVILSDTSIQI